MNAAALQINDSAEAPATEIKTILFGRFMLPDSTEHACQVAGLTEEGAIFIADVDVPAGLQVVAYIDEVGRIEGSIAEAVDGGFRLKFNLTHSRRERIAARLKWLANKGEDGADENNRRHARFEPKDTKSHITLPDGRVYQCEVIDISLSGAAVKTGVMPSMGTYVFVGKMRGRVVRYLENGIAVEFVTPLDQASLNSAAATA